MDKQHLRTSRFGALYFAITLLSACQAFRTSGIPGANPLRGPTVIGCFADDQHESDFKFAANEDAVAITPKKCREMCKQRWFQYAAVQNGDTCWCGSSYGKYGRRPDIECQTKPCSEDPSQFCGGFLRNKVMRSGYTLDNVYQVDKCWEVNDDGILATKVYEGMKNSHSYCKSLCGVFNKKYAAVQAGTDCWCSDDFFSQSLVESDDCDDACSGNIFEKCGTSSSMIPMHSQKTGSDIGLKLVIGCYIDLMAETDSHVFTIDSQKEGFRSETLMTRQYCQKGCGKLGYEFAGVTDGAQCWCGDALDFENVFLTDSEHCNVPCRGNKLQTCGGDGFVNVLPSIHKRK